MPQPTIVKDRMGSKNRMLVPKSSGTAESSETPHFTFQVGSLEYRFALVQQVIPVGANDRHQRMAGEDYPCQDANYRHSAAWLGSPALFAVVLNGRNAVPLGRDFILCVKVRFDNIAFFNFEHDYRLRLTCRLIVTAHRNVNTPSKPISV